MTGLDQAPVRDDEAVEGGSTMTSHPQSRDSWGWLFVVREMATFI